MELPADLIARQARRPQGLRVECERCDGSGFVVDEATRTAFDCDCRGRRRQVNRVRRLVAGMPRSVGAARLAETSFGRRPVTDIAATSPANERAVAELARWCAAVEGEVAAGRGVGVIGGGRCGKTTLALLAYRAAIEAGLTANVQVVVELLEALRRSYGDGASRTLAELHDQLAAVDLLVLDDLRIEHATGWAADQLLALVNRRSLEGRAIVWTADVDRAEDLERVHDRRLVSRLLDGALVLRLDAPGGGVSAAAA